ncbi:MAG TPA: 50S ribosomal protein L22 [Planctomycetes bacterium]|nr:50S ribosomal protein L22 [Planctomycetota bacterium]HIJ71034.1 50S ribosomal protein L22 [Planctomycetota bacterium]
MLSCSRLKELCSQRDISIDGLSGHLARGGFDRKAAAAALKNWQKGLYKPKPRSEDIERLASGLGVEPARLSQWEASHRYAPMSARKVRLVAQLIRGRSVQDALDILKFTHKRAARMIEKVLESAIANADEQEADVENLYVCRVRVDDAGLRIGTKRWIPKDRGRTNPIRKHASHIHIAVAEE